MKKPCSSFFIAALATLILALQTPLCVLAQSTLFYENFESGTAGQFDLNTSDESSTVGGYNFWLVNNAYTGGTGSLICLGFPFTYTIANTPSQPGGVVGSPNSYYMHTLSQEGFSDGIFCSSFAAADGICFMDQHIFTKMTSDVSTVGYSGVEFSFYWACSGGDNIYGEVYYSTDGGSSWILITSPIAQYKNQTSWVQQTITIPAFDGQATLRFGFRLYDAASSTAADPGMSIDEVKITGGCSTSTSTINPAICQGASYTSPSGNYTWNTSGTYMDTIPNTAGCDSVVTVNLTINSLPTIALTLNPDTVCITTGSYTLTGGTPAGGTYSGSGVSAGNFDANAAGAGLHYITYSYTDGNNCSNMDSAQIYVDACTGIEIISMNNLVSVFPNPFSSQTIFQTDIPLHNAILTVDNCFGQTVAQIKNISGQTVVFSRDNLASGLYFVRLTEETKIIAVYRIVITDK